MDKPKLVGGSAVSPEVKKFEPSQKDAKGKDGPATKPGPQLLTQREAVYVEVMNIIRQEKITVPQNQAVKPHLNETHVKKICAAIAAGFQTKKIALKDTEANKKKLVDPKLLETYCLGLLNNWLRRDQRLNGTPAKK